MTRKGTRRTRRWAAFATGAAAAFALLPAVAPAHHQDYDGDGHTGPDDCAPLDPAVYKGAPDRPDLDFEDTDCDGIDGDRATSVFVSADGNDRSGGTAGAPFRTIAQGITEANGGWVLVTTGTYEENLAVPPGAKVAGGYEHGTWTRSSAPETIVKGSPQAVLVKNATGVVLQQLTLIGTSGTALSAYGLRAIDSTVAVVGSRVTAGAGADGVNRGHPGQPVQAASGEDGGRSGSVSTGSGGEGGALIGPGGAGGQGGNGGSHKNTAGNKGERGQGAGGEGGDGGKPDGPATVDGRPGTAGKDGAPGANGSGGGNSLDLAGAEWLGHAGAGGSTGANGGGGGGGGGGAGRETCTLGICDYGAGAGGGGGGQGGTGGQGGAGGGAGGASFGVYLWNSKLVSLGSTISSGQGGAGGHGGRGAPGGRGGGGGAGGEGCGIRRDCDITVGDGGVGGAGGNGGDGGHGGGGAGGPSAAIFRGGSSIATVKRTNLSHGAGGNGGAAPAPGATGQAGDLLGDGGSENPDFDGDTTPDATDNCPDVAGPGEGGCLARAPRLPDGDRDGVPDAHDRCPGEAAGTDVDEDGCTDVDLQRDTDLDGVPDIRDRCPGQHGGAFDLDRDGCPGPYLPVSPASPTLSVKLLKKGVRVVSFGTVAPRNARVELRCVKKCGKRSGREVFPPTAQSGIARTVTSRRLRRHRLPFGARLTVTITRPGSIGFHRRYTTIRRPPGFKRVDMCIPEGHSRPARVCPG